MASSWAAPSSRTVAILGSGRRIAKNPLSGGGSDCTHVQERTQTGTQQGTAPALRRSCNPNSCLQWPRPWLEANVPLDSHLAAGRTGPSLKGPRSDSDAGTKAVLCPEPGTSLRPFHPATPKLAWSLQSLEMEKEIYSSLTRMHFSCHCLL